MLFLVSEEWPENPTLPTPIITGSLCKNLKHGVFWFIRCRLPFSRNNRKWRPDNWVWVTTITATKPVIVAITTCCKHFSTKHESFWRRHSFNYSVYKCSRGYSWNNHTHYRWSLLLPSKIPLIKRKHHHLMWTNRARRLLFIIAGNKNNLYCKQMVIIHSSWSYNSFLKPISVLIPI